MSHSKYNKLLAEAMLELSRLLTKELPAKPPSPQKDRVVFVQQVATLYVRYIQIFRKLETIYDQMIQPQKRRAVRGILDSVIGRVLELKNELVEKEFSEYHYVNDILLSLKLTHEKLEIPIPHYFLSECSKVVQERKGMLTDLFKMMEVTESLGSLTTEEMSQEEAIKIIQIEERARQGRLRAKLTEESLRLNRRNAETLDQNSAAICIQKVWKGYVQRKKSKIAQREEMICLGMVMDPKYDGPSPAQIEAEAIDAHNSIKQKEVEESYQKSLEVVKNQLHEKEGYDIRKTLKSQIREWFFECRNATGVFPDYPDEEDGGSALIFMEKSPLQLMKEMDEAKNGASNTKSNGKEETKENEKAKKKGSIIVREEDEEAGLKMLPSAFLSELEARYKSYMDVWGTRDVSGCFHEEFDVELMKEELRKVVEAELRVQVDEEMRQELAELKLSVDKNMRVKTKADAKKKKVSGKSKSGKKKEKEKDLTADRTLESLCQELVEQGLLKQANNVKMKDYLGDYNYLGSTLRLNDIEPMPSLLDVRQVLSLYAVLPLGSQEVHEKAPLIKAILLVGPSGVGKKMLVHAICQDAGANLFDLSPLNIAGKYPGKNGLEMMLHMVLKVARLLQPSVIWINNAEKIFYKKIPIEDKELDLKQLKKELPELLKLIKGEDRVLVIGTTENPQSADTDSLCKMYTKIILIPRPDYGSRYILWKKLIKQRGGADTSPLFSVLAKVSDGYTSGRIVQTINRVVTKRRIQQQARKPLSASEFIPILAQMDPVFKEEEEALKNWYAMTPLGQKRIKAATGKGTKAPPPKGKVAKKKKKK
ncbi:dynein regulatory complex protein 11 [Nematolebias whitei]|uniref:dynein regulatory complex protein 11 n=1 Tax=Nematolebias whitei TaxID=451745 RepID=UPI001898EF98|nr:dynein regulatory complex protein 11 [Nematolebias whitei]